MEIAGHELSFSNCAEIGRGGPIACELVIDGCKIRGEYDPSPVPYGSGILIPVRKTGLLSSGYALCFVDLRTMEMKTISKVHGYMRITKVVGDQVEFNPKAYGDKLQSLHISLD